MSASGKINGSMFLGGVCCSSFVAGAGFAHASLGIAETQSVVSNLASGTTIAGLTLTYLAARSLYRRNHEYNLVSSTIAARLQKIRLDRLSPSVEKTTTPEEDAIYFLKAGAWMNLQTLKLVILYGAFSFSAGISARGFYEFTNGNQTF